ncbi:TrmB family transcriptional regulator [Halorubrum trueperi]|uniref:TrmB family transcriptional regulator n=1 Tax=Halorubrum trueperi TaxID=2004704 RepID=A0ABD5UJI8_9EURY
MSPDPTESPSSAAIDLLERFGLSTYAARTYVALVHLEIGSARDVSEVTEVPRTRVYDAADELRERGLVGVRESSPKQFWSVSPDTAIRTFDHEYRNRANRLRTALAELEPVDHHREQRGVWTVEGRAAVDERVCTFFADAESEIVYATVDELVTDDVLDALRAAVERGVSVRLAGVSDDDLARARGTTDGVQSFEPPWPRSATSVGRFAMIDGGTTLVSALVDDAADSTHRRSETAVWGNGDANGVVTVISAIFTRNLDRDDD